METKGELLHGLRIVSTEVDLVIIEERPLSTRGASSEDL